jgi:hypothetical protein
MTPVYKARPVPMYNTWACSTPHCRNSSVWMLNTHPNSGGLYEPCCRQHMVAFITSVEI